MRPLSRPFPSVLASKIALYTLTVVPSWGRFNFVESAKYLGFLFGPNAVQSSWSAPMVKFRQRISQIKALRLSPSLAAHLFNMCAVPVLLYVAQLLPARQKLESVSKAAITSLMGVPFTGFGARGPLRFNDVGGPRFQSPVVAALSARIRVARRIFGSHDFVVAHLRVVAVEFLSLGEGRRFTAPAFWDVTSVAEYIDCAYNGMPTRLLVHEFVAPYSLCTCRPSFRAAG